MQQTQIPYGKDDQSATLGPSTATALRRSILLDEICMCLHRGSIRSAHPYAAVLLAYFVALAILGTALPAHFGFPLDDSWIHQTVGRNFAQFNSLGFLPHQRSSGSTSLLWTLIVAANYALLPFPKLSPILFCLAVNALCLVSIGLILLRLARRDGMPPALAILWAAAPAANGNFVWLAFTGMEHLLFLALSLASILLWLDPDAGKRTRTAALAGLTLGLLAMTRPEGIVLAALLLLLSRPAHRTRRDALLTGSLAAALAAVPFLINLATSHALLPVTFKGRQWMYFAAGGGPWTYRKQLLQQWVMRPGKAVLPLEGAALSPHARLLVYAGTALILTLAAVALYSLVIHRRIATLVVCAWAALHSLLYVLILPVSGHGGRYQPFLLLLLAPLLALGLERSLVRLIRNRMALALTTVILAAAAAISLLLWRSVLAAGIDHIQTSHGAMAAFLTQQHLAEPVAVFDIGRIGYQLHGNLVDLGGLTDSSYVAYLTSGRVPQYLAERHISLVVLPVRHDGTTAIGDQLRLMNNPGLTLQPLHCDCTPAAIWQLGWAETRHATQCQELFRIRPSAQE